MCRFECSAGCLCSQRRRETKFLAIMTEAATKSPATKNSAATVKLILAAAECKSHSRRNGRRDLGRTTSRSPKSFVFAAKRKRWDGFKGVSQPETSVRDRFGGVGHKESLADALGCDQIDSSPDSAEEPKKTHFLVFRGSLPRLGEHIRDHWKVRVG